MRRLLLLSFALTASCKSGIDLDQGRAYACSRDGGDDASQCGSGFRCGLEGVCHAVGNAAAWKCQTASDCEASWTCGLEGTCHDPAVASNYLCTDDVHCAGGWRCGFTGRCLDPSGEALGTRDQKATGVTLLAPKLSSQPPPGNELGFDLTSFTFRSGTAWVTQSLTTQDSWINDAGTAAGGSVASAGPVAFIVEGSEFSALDVATGSRPWVVLPAGGPVDATGGVLRTIQNIPNADVAMIRNGAGGTSSSYVLANRQGSSSGVLAGPATSIADLASVDGCGVATTPNGLFAGDLVAATWSPLSVPGFFGCGMPASFEPLRLRTAEGLTAVAGKAGTPGSPTQLAVFDTSGFGSGTADGGTRCLPDGPVCTDDRWVLRVGPCEPCETGEDLVDFHPANDANAGTVAVAECTSPQSGTQFYLLRPGQAKEGCGRDRVYPLSDLSSVGVDSSNGSMFGRAGQHGQFWFGATPIDARSVFFDRAPQVLAIAADGGSPVVFSGGLGGAVTGVIGIPTFTLPDGVEALTGVDGEPTLVMLSRGLIVRLGSDELVGLVNASSDLDLRPPFHASVGRKPDGGQELIASSFDTLYSGPFYPGPYQGEDRSLSSKIKPFPGSAIDSLAPYLEQLPDGGTGLSAWVLTSNGLFNVRAESDKRWRALDVPLPQGDALEVWTEGDKGRVGFSDGVVFSLPSRVPLARPLPDGDLAIDYLFACQQTYALGFDGVYRLSPRPGGVGEWVLEALGANPHTFDFDALSAGRLFVLDGRIYLFTSFGGALSFVPTGGCPP